jgi:Rrf2 family protein
LEITRRADLAVRALGVLTWSDRRMKASELAESIGTSTGYATQALGPLVEAGWVESEPGRNGGYRATPQAVRVSVLEVIEAVDGATDDGGCVVADRPCRSAEPCAVHGAWARARGELTAELSGTAVADLRPTAVAAGVEDGA